MHAKNCSWYPGSGPWEETQESMPMSPGVKCRHTRAGSKSSASHMGAEPRTKCFKHTILKKMWVRRYRQPRAGYKSWGDSAQAQGAHVHRVHRVSTCTECTECTEACSACKAGKYSSNVSNRCSQRHRLNRVPKVGVLGEPDGRPPPVLLNWKPFCCPPFCA